MRFKLVFFLLPIFFLSGMAADFSGAPYYITTKGDSSEIYNHINGFKIYTGGWVVPTTYESKLKYTTEVLIRNEGSDTSIFFLQKFTMLNRSEDSMFRPFSIDSLLTIFKEGKWSKKVIAQAISENLPDSILIGPGECFLGLIRFAGSKSTGSKLEMCDMPKELSLTYDTIQIACFELKEEIINQKGIDGLYIGRFGLEREFKLGRGVWRKKGCVSSLTNRCN